MIVDLPSTTTADVAKKLVRLRADTGSMALSRVLTLLVVVDESDADSAIDTANRASRQHPCRIIVVVAGNKRGAARLDAQIRLGGDAGASEVVVLRLYGKLANHGRAVVTPLLLPTPPSSRGGPARPRRSPRPTRSARWPSAGSPTPPQSSQAPRTVLRRLSEGYVDGDTDLAWSRITLWRGLLAAALDQPPYEPVTSATVVAATDSPSGDLLAGWLAVRLRCPVIDRPRPQPQRHHLGAARAGQRHRRPGAPARRQHRDAVPAGPAGAHPGAPPPRAMPSASPTSCAASTPTRSTRTPW